MFRKHVYKIPKDPKFVLLRISSNTSSFILSKMYLYLPFKQMLISISFAFRWFSASKDSESVPKIKQAKCSHQMVTLKVLSIRLNPGHWNHHLVPVPSRKRTHIPMEKDGKGNSSSPNTFGGDMVLLSLRGSLYMGPKVTDIHACIPVLPVLLITAWMWLMEFDEHRHVRLGQLIPQVPRHAS